jgi:hypothetical protein
VASQRQNAVINCKSIGRFLGYSPPLDGIRYSIWRKINEKIHLAEPLALAGAAGLAHAQSSVTLYAPRRQRALHEL